MHEDVIRRPLQSGCAEYFPKAIYELLYAGWSVYMQVGRARIASRPRTCMQKRDKVREMIRMEMRHNDVVQFIVLDTDLKKPLEYAAMLGVLLGYRLLAWIIPGAKRIVPNAEIGITRT